VVHEPREDFFDQIYSLLRRQPPDEGDDGLWEKGKSRKTKKILREIVFNRLILSMEI